jgi:hypothetical protein
MSTFKEIVHEKLVKARVDLIQGNVVEGILAGQLILCDVTEEPGGWIMTSASDGHNFYYNNLFINRISNMEIRSLMISAIGSIDKNRLDKFNVLRTAKVDLPTAEDVLFGKVTEFKINDLGDMYSFTISVCNRLQAILAMAKEKEGDAFKMKLFKYFIEDEDEEQCINLLLDGWHECVDNFFTFMLNNLSIEMCVLGGRLVLREYALPVNHRQLKSFAPWHNLLGKYILED